MPVFRQPGVYIEELSLFPPSVAAVESAIPAFIGYTASAMAKVAGDLLNVPLRIRSLIEFEACYGKGPESGLLRVNVDGAGNFMTADIAKHYFLYDSLRLFYDNGGGDCYIVSVGNFGQPVSQGQLRAGVDALVKVDEATLLLFPDAATLSADDLCQVQQAALAQCGQLKDRFAVLDLRQDDPRGGSFRDKIGIDNLKYGAAYTPWLKLSYSQNIRYAQIHDKVFQKASRISLTSLSNDPQVLECLFKLDTLLAERPDAENELLVLEAALYKAFPLYRAMVDGINSTPTSCPPSGAVVGVYARVDREHGVWKAPANVALSGVVAPGVSFSARDTESLNVDTNAGKSINAIRAFSGKGTMIWGARTLAGNDNEWRYVSVRRFFNMVEESLTKSSGWVVFEPNDANTWAKVRAMIENFLILQWRAGALAGAKVNEAFFVKCGLGTTMSQQDILEGRLIVEIGLAVVRPAEFIILKFSHKMQGA